MNAALLPILRRAWRPLSAFLVLAGLLLAPSTASAWWSHDWSYRRAVTITPPAAAGALVDVPVLVRLHDGNFKFDEASANGEDLRFVGEDDKTPLKFHIEKYDSVFNMAAVWVRVPALKVGGPTTIYVYYGNAKAVAGSEPAATYDSSTALVWHFGERNAPPADASVNANAGTSAVVSDDEGLVGGAARLDGNSTIGVPASPALATTAGGGLSWSAWIRPAAAACDGVLYARHDGARSLVIGLEKGAPYVAITGDTGDASRRTAATPIEGTSWHHLAVVSAEQKITLYVDGTAGPVLDIPSLPALATAATLGGDAGAKGFAGLVDELQIGKSARAAGWMALAFANQGAGDSVVGLGLEEQLSTWSSGYIGIILSSVTLDGWIVIGVLGVMALISWLIMVTKARQINKVAGANRVFLRTFRRVGDDWGAMAAIAGGTAAVAGVDLKEGERRRMQRSPLLHMFNAGVDELQTRLTTRQNRGLKGPLSSRAIEAIRASLDSSMVTETQSLNRLMVLLTIAISGGPFIGLLGTVVGVMITFAAIAASGDVNVNSIAPGIAAALAATVAGLVVAIPALFGYNYLISRIKEITAEMNVFLDAFVTRMAEGDDAAETLIDGAP